MNCKQYQKKVQQILQDMKLPPNIKSFIHISTDQLEGKNNPKSISLTEVTSTLNQKF
jgi:uncharacterized protein (UPF0147 family)